MLQSEQSYRQTSYSSSSKVSVAGQTLACMSRRHWNAFHATTLPELHAQRGWQKHALDQPGSSPIWKSNMIIVKLLPSFRRCRQFYSPLQNQVNNHGPQTYQTIARGEEDNQETSKRPCCYHHLSARFALELSIYTCEHSMSHSIWSNHERSITFNGRFVVFCKSHHRRNSRNLC